MPFKSAKQRTFLRKKHPKVFKKWASKYGTKVRTGKLKRDNPYRKIRGK